MSEWKPIDEAAKDEDAVLLYSKRDGVQPGYWDERHGWLVAETQGLTGGNVTPTHYALLPAPPVEQDGQ